LGLLMSELTELRVLWRLPSCAEMPLMACVLAARLGAEMAGGAVVAGAVVAGAVVDGAVVAGAVVDGAVAGGETAATGLVPISGLGDADEPHATSTVAAMADVARTAIFRFTCTKEASARYIARL